MSRRLSEALMSCLRCLGNSKSCGCFIDISGDEEQAAPLPLTNPVSSRSAPVATGAVPAEGSNQQPQPQPPLQPPSPAPARAAAEAATTTTASQPILNPSGVIAGPSPPNENRSILEAAFEEAPGTFQEPLSATDIANRLQEWLSAPDPLFDDDPALAHLKYNKFQNVGAQRRRWMEDSNEADCPVQPSTLKFADLRQNHNFREPKIENINWILEDQVKRLGLPNEFGSDSGPRFNIEVSNSSGSSESDPNTTVYLRFQGAASYLDFNWTGSTGPGIIVMDNIYREPWSATPKVAYVAKAIYESQFPLGSLKHVFVTRIMNVNTERFVRERLYTENNNLTWPKTDTEEIEDYPPIEWENGTAEYDALLGTTFGKILTYLVLSAYPRGSRTIARVVTWPVPFCMRFDIEDLK